jgi:glycine cleavage system H protein
MAKVLDDRKYTNEHEWVLVDGDTVRIGISDYAQGELGDIVFVELPDVGSRVEQGKPFTSIEAVKTVAELFGPVNGTITEVNEAVQDDSSVVNSDCYGKGWIVCIKPDNQADVGSLLDAEAYKKLIG